MIDRLNYVALNPTALQNMMKAKNSLPSIPERLRALSEVRISQINGCAYCVDLHIQQARKAGETEQRLDFLTVWHEVPFFEPDEKAALAWAEAVTKISEDGAPGAIYDALSEHFSGAQIVDLTWIIHR